MESRNLNALSMQIIVLDKIKNKSLVAYFMWRTLVDLNKEITLSFMRVGHTRIVDACFGLINTLQEL